MKPIRITRHARNRMRWHGIDDRLVERAVRRAESEDPSASGRVNAWIEVEDRLLRVTYRDEADQIVVISAVFKRKPPRRRGDR